MGGSHRAWFIWQLCGHGRDMKVYFKNFGSQLFKERHVTLVEQEVILHPGGADAL